MISGVQLLGLTTFFEGRVYDFEDSCSNRRFGNSEEVR